MDLYQLKTFVCVAREGSVTRASEVLHLSQPAVSAHIKGIEDALGLTLFERTPRGMSLTPEGERLLERAERTLAVHQDLMDEATRLKGHLTGKLRLGAGGNATHASVGKLVTTLSERCPDVEVVLRHGTSQEIVAGLHNGSLDAGFYNEPGEAQPDLEAFEVARFTIFVVAAKGQFNASHGPDWSALGEHPWVYPTASACCGRTAESLFRAHHIRPKRIISVDREDVTRTLVAGGIGVGLLHADTALEASRRGEVDLLFEAPAQVRVVFAYLANRARDPLLVAAASILQDRPLKT